jgi:TrmH family RNA methyltransferase
MYKDITGSGNKYIKHIKSLNIKKYRDTFGEYLIEGKKILEEAIYENVEIKSVVINDKFLNSDSSNSERILDQLNNRNIDVFRIPEKIFKDISNTENPQGVMAILKINEISINDFIQEGNPSFLIFCENIQDPGNMGTIIRTADAAGVDGVLVSKGCVDIYSPKVVRSTMGSLFHLPIIKINDNIEVINHLRTKKYKIICTHLTGTEFYYNIDAVDKIIVLIGNESNGASEQLASQSDCLVKIPMFGKAESLNAAVAAGILMYEVALKNRYLK